SGAGGGLSMLLDSATVSGTTFTDNLAQSATNSAGAVFGTESGGGAVLASVFTSLQLTDSAFTGNEAIGNTGGAGISGGAGANGGIGGDAQGGGVYNAIVFGAFFGTPALLTVTNTSVVNNQAVGGAGGAGGAGGSGGNGQGGGFFNSATGFLGTVGQATL